MDHTFYTVLHTYVGVLLVDVLCGTYRSINMALLGGCSAGVSGALAVWRFPPLHLSHLDHYNGQRIVRQVVVMTLYQPKGFGAGEGEEGSDILLYQQLVLVTTNQIILPVQKLSSNNAYCAFDMLHFFLLILFEWCRNSMRKSYCKHEGKG